MIRYQTPKKRGQVNTMITVDDVDQIREKIKNQSWEGVQAVDGLPGQGRGLKATRSFQQHEVVCDCNAELLNHKEGILLDSNDCGVVSSYICDYCVFT